MTQTLASPDYGPVRRHSPRRRRRRLRITIAVVLAAAAATTVGAAHELLDDEHRAYLSADGWPRHGQGAYQLGDQPTAASPDQRAVPIASLAKVMTAYLVLQHFPLGSGGGHVFRVTAADVRDTEDRRRSDQSLVDVRAGERLTERQALLAILLPSANNVAVLVARQTAGSVPAFVAEMNETADELKMDDTTYTDPSGFDDRTVSTARDQLLLARHVAGDATLAELMATPSAQLPVAGQVNNTNTLLGRDGFVGMKTGSDDAAGGCFMFRTRRFVEGRTVYLVGVVLGQHGRNLITAGLSAARQLADRLAPAAAAP